MIIIPFSGYKLRVVFLIFFCFFFAAHGIRCSSSGSASNAAAAAAASASAAAATCALRCSTVGLDERTKWSRAERGAQRSGSAAQTRRPAPRRPHTCRCHHRSAGRFSLLNLLRVLIPRDCHYLLLIFSLLKCLPDLHCIPDLHLKPIFIL